MSNNILFERIYHQIMSRLSKEVKTILEEQEILYDMENLLEPRNSSFYYKELVHITDEIQKKINNNSITEVLNADFMNKDLSEFLKKLKNDFNDKFSYLKSSYIEYIDALHFFIYDDQHIKTKSGNNVCGDVIDIVTVEIDEQVIERIKEFMKQYGYVLELKRTIEFAA